MKKFILAALVSLVAFGAIPQVVNAAPSGNYLSFCPDGANSPWTTYDRVSVAGCQPKSFGASNSYVNHANAELFLTNAWPAGSDPWRGVIEDQFRNWMATNYGVSGSYPVYVIGTSNTYSHAGNRVHAFIWMYERVTRKGCAVSADVSGTDFNPTINLAEHGFVHHGCWQFYAGGSPVYLGSI